MLNEESWVVLELSVKTYRLFLFDLDDTLLDFKESERLSFESTLRELGVSSSFQELFSSYQRENLKLWKLFEEAQVSKEFLKVERFRKTFELHGLDLDSKKASEFYLERLPETIVLVDYALEICQSLSRVGEIGILTNGIQTVQEKRVQNSVLFPYLSFLSVSEECGFAKPDQRFFAHSMKKAKSFDRNSTLMIGDRVETDVLGAHQFGIDACWFNPQKKVNTIPSGIKYTEIHHLSHLEQLI